MTTFTAPQTIRRPRAQTVAIGAAALAAAIGVGIGTSRIIDNQTSDGGANVPSVDLTVPSAHDTRTVQPQSNVTDTGVAKSGAGAASVVPAAPSAPPWDAGIELINGSLPPGVVVAAGPSVLTSPYDFEQFIESQVRAETATDTDSDAVVLDLDGQFADAIVPRPRNRGQDALLDEAAFEQLVGQQVGPR